MINTKGMPRKTYATREQARSVYQTRQNLKAKAKKAVPQGVLRTKF